MAEENRNDGASDFKLEENMTPEELKQLTEDEDFLIGFKEEDFSDGEKVARLEEALKNSKTTIHQKRHYRAKIEELSKPKTPETPRMPVRQKTEDTDSISQNEILNFKIDHPEIPREVISGIVKFAKANDMNLEDSLKEDVVKAMVKEKSAKIEVEDGTPPPTNRTGGQFIGAKDWSGASNEEMDQARLRIMYPNG